MTKTPMDSIPFAALELPILRFFRVSTFVFRASSVTRSVCAAWLVLGLCCSMLWAEPAADAPQQKDFEIRPGFRVIDSLGSLRDCLTASGQKIRMKPGTYRITAAAEDNKTVLHVGGCDNYFDLRGVTLQLPTEILAALRGKVHELCVYRLTGNNVTFEGGLFEDLGDEPPYQSLSEFGVTGDGNTFKDCTFIIRGSAPYGYGDLFGKGAGAKVRLQKHAAMSVHGDNTKILGCRFMIHTFGHAIHMHGAQNTLVQDVYVEGELRSTDEILGEKEGPAVRFGYKDHYGRPIPKGVMLCLAEDGIRAYLDGGHDKPQPRTGDITVINCTVKRMRGGITLDLASGKVVVRGCTVTESGYPGHAYSVPSNGVIRDCRGDAAYTPLLHLGYSHKQKADVELQLLETLRPVGNETAARINGFGHKVTITRADATAAPIGNLKILLGETYRGDEADVGKTSAREIELENGTAHEVVLSPVTSVCTVRSIGPIADHGKENKTTRLAEPKR